MIRVFVFILMVLLWCQPARAQSSEQDLAQGSMIQEQAAICAAFARVMEYSGLLEENRGMLWRERRFYAGALLRKTVKDNTGEEPSNGMIDGIIAQYSKWMIDLFTISTAGSGDEADERNKLKDYVSTFCTPLFTNADRAIAGVRPELFDLTAPQPVSAQPEETPVVEAETKTPAPSTPEDIKPEPSTPEDEPQETAAAPSMTDENIAKLIDENMTLRERVQLLEKDLMAASESLNRVLTARTVVTEDITGETTITVLEDSQKSTPQPADDPADNLAGADIAPPAPTEGEGIIDVTRQSVTKEETEEAPEIMATGRMQVQLASYSSMKNAKTGMAMLTEKIPAEHADIDFNIVSTTLASGKDVFRVVSTPIAMDEAKSICTYFWSLQFGCIIKMTGNS